ncbi:hypothetical protein CK203_014596 [Vitis vinifera]|uniref:Uncharacterized protein n=1 Tax=Vitis vinifera TaxID=29760 RepID=A0A438K563_VITVI|nr:hypothetical protein CK203_014596 [Vitis vinifera]
MWHHASAIPKCPCDMKLMGMQRITCDIHRGRDIHIGHPMVEERVRKKGRDFRKSKTGSVLAYKVSFRE